jgi:hypothetical protein
MKIQKILHLFIFDHFLEIRTAKSRSDSTRSGFVYNA